MPLNFPSTPATSTTYTFNNKTWTYNGNAWALSTGGSLNTSVVPEGSNLYFSNARAIAAITNTSLSNITVTNNVTSGASLTTGSSTAGTYQTSGNVNSNNLRVVTASSLGTVQSGTWNGTSISTTYTDAKIVAVSNTAPVSVTTSSGTATVSLLSSGVSATTYGGSTAIPVLTVDTYGRVTSASNVSVTSGTTITDDTTTNTTRYITLTSSSSGSISTANVSTSKLFFNPSTGLLTSTDYNSSSDKRLKNNIKTVENAVETITALRGVTFDWKEGSTKGIGLIAQEVEKIIPEVVNTDEDGYKGIKYTNIIGILVEAIKEQQEQINNLKKQIEKL